MPRERHPDPLIQHHLALANHRCEDCGGYTTEAARLGIGSFGQFCTCPFDAAHP